LDCKHFGECGSCSLFAIDSYTQLRSKINRVTRLLKLFIYDELEFEIPTQEAVDVYARALVRREEMNQSIKILEQVVDKIPNGEVMIKMPTHRKFKLPKDDTWVKVESARGEFAYYLAGDGSEKIRRMQVRGPSLVHAYTLLEELLVGEELSNVAVIMNSLGICPPEIER
jgi:NADH-quinone oxidoreductase subunit D